MNQSEMAAKLAKLVDKKYGTQRKAAEAWGVSPALVSGVLRGERRPSTVMLDDVGYKVANLSPSYVKKEKK